MDEYTKSGYKQVLLVVSVKKYEDISFTTEKQSDKNNVVSISCCSCTPVRQAELSSLGELQISRHFLRSAINPLRIEVAPCV